MLKKVMQKFVVCGLVTMLCTSIGVKDACSGQVLRDLQVTGKLQVMQNLQGLHNMQISHDLQAMQNLQESQGTLVQYTKADTKVIPDKYNTGCQGTLKTVEKNSEDKVVIEGIEIREDADLMRYIFDFYYKNKSVSGTVYIENYDFSDHSFWAYNLDKVDREIKVVFNNCKFSSANFGRGDSKVSFEFNRCTMNSFYGGNTTLNRCQFGKSFSDGVVPFTNIQVNDCFFSDMASVVTDKGAHTDGTQIYGYANLDVENVYYDNCRFAIPAVRPEGSAAYVNACIMLQLEYSSAKNLAFTDCIVNGGGYSIYARSVDEAFTFENVSFDGLRFGCAKRWGVVCSGADKSIAFKNVEQTSSLYIGSVWKENGETHLSVTNDTNRERTLLVYTDRGEYSYTIPACPLVSESTLSMVYTDFPFDMDIVIPADCQYVVCFDNTNTGNGTQIRYVNWSESDVYLTDEFVTAMYGAGDEILVEGTCGKEITFTLTRDGVLTLTGTGDTYNYHSQKFPEWIDYIDYIQEIRVEEGITGLGSMIFRNCTSVKKVTLPDSLTTIGQYAFGGCVSIAEMTLPANITTLGKNVFSGTILQEIHYAGENWDAIEIGTGNEDFVSRVVKDNQITNEQNANSSSTIANKTQNTNSSSAIADKTQNNISNQVKDNAGKVNKPSKVKGLKLKKKKVKNSKNGKVNKKKANLKISWKKVKGANGYQIAMKTGKKGKYKIVKTIKKNAKTTFVKKNLKKGKKYFVKVRAYQVVNGKKVYGKYCKAKKIKL